MGHRPRTQNRSTSADTHYPTSPPRRLKDPSHYLDIEYKNAGVRIRRPAADTLDASAELARQVSRDTRAKPLVQSGKYDPYPRATVSEASIPRGILKGYGPSVNDSSREKKIPLEVNWRENLSEDIGPPWWMRSRRPRHSEPKKWPHENLLRGGSDTVPGEEAKRKDHSTKYDKLKDHNGSTKRLHKSMEVTPNGRPRQEGDGTFSTSKLTARKDNKETIAKTGVKHQTGVPEALRLRQMKYGSRKPPHAHSYLKEQRANTWGQ